MENQMKGFGWYGAGVGVRVAWHARSQCGAHYSCHASVRGTPEGGMGHTEPVWDALLVPCSSHRDPEGVCDVSVTRTYEGARVEPWTPTSHVGRKNSK